MRDTRVSGNADNHMTASSIPNNFEGESVTDRLPT